MTTIKIMSAGAVKEMVVSLGAEFETATGIKLDLNFGTVGSMRARVEKGETADVMCLSQSAIAALDKAGHVLPGSIVNLADTVTGVVVRAGAARPDISTVEAFKAALLAAPSVAYVDPQAGGSSGIMFAALIERLGIADAINKKAVLGKNGHDVATLVADGRAEIGTTFISEILPVKGTQVLGLLPGELHNANTYTAALHAGTAEPEAARAFVTALTDKATRARWTAAGLEPAF